MCCDVLGQTGAELQAMLDVVEAYVSWRRMKFKSTKSKVMVVGEREARVSWKIGKEIVEEVEEFKYLGVSVDRKLRGKCSVRENGKKKAEEWIGKVTWMSRVNGRMEVDREDAVGASSETKYSM